MATLMVRDVDDAQHAQLAAMAKANGRSVAAEMRAIIAEATRKQAVAAVIAEMREIAKRSTPLPNGMTSLDLLREERDSW